MNKIYLCWENGESKKDRVLHIFGEHKDAMEFVSKTDGLREWNAYARYHARDAEVVNHNANVVVHHSR